MRSLNILFVEDTLADFLLIQRELRTAGMLGDFLRVDERDALVEALHNRQWDLVLSDYAVPGMLFTETLGRILHEFPQLPIILVSGTIGDVKADVMVKLGAWGFVSKDRLHELVPAIQQAMQRVPAPAPVR